MIFSLLFLSLISASISIIFSISPLSLGVWIIIIALLFTISLRLLCSSWFTFLIFLIYVGGLLVIFSYFVAIQPNQLLGIFKIFLISIISLSYLSLISSYIFNFPTSIFLQPQSITLNLLFPNSSIILLLAGTLFLVLIAVVKISYSAKAPLRPFY